MLAAVSSGAAEAERSRRIAALRWDYATRELEPVKVCNLCGASEPVELSRRDRYGFAATAQSCARCGLIWLSPRLTAAEYGAFYASTYRPLVSAYHGRLIDARTVQEEQRRYADELVGFVRQSLANQPSSVLDVGGSTGVVAAAFRDAFGAEATVLDPSPEELAHAAAAGMDTVAGFAEEAALEGRRFELVLLCQTIDHLLDVAATLRSIRDWVTPGGHVFVDVLDLEFMLLRQGSIEEAIKVDHPFSLTRDTALAHFRRAGLRPIAERLADDGHLGFLLAPTEPDEPDWDALRAAGDDLRRRIWRLRASA